MTSILSILINKKSFLNDDFFIVLQLNVIFGNIVLKRRKIPKKKSIFSDSFYLDQPIDIHMIIFTKHMGTYEMDELFSDQVQDALV